MAKTKKTKKRPLRKPTRNATGQAIDLLCRLVGNSRDVNQTDRRELADLAKAIKG